MAEELELIGGDPPILRDRQLGFQHPANRSAWAYWRTKAPDQAVMPRRTQIDPVEMRGFLAHVGLIEVTIENGAPRYRLRLVGSMIEDVFGPVTGQPLDEALPGPIADRWRLVLDTGVRGREPLRAVTRILHQGKSFLSAEILLAPMSEDGQTVSMLFTSAAYWTSTEAPTD